MSYDNIPAEIQAYEQWINWRYEQIKEADGTVKWTKLPIRTIDGYKASVTDPRDWTTFARAKGVAEATGYGIGFVFTKSDPFVGIDLDDAGGNPGIMDTQRKIYEHLNSYSELSPSGNGLHIIVKAELPGTGRRKGKLECYDNFRFFTFTGNVVNPSPVMQRSEETLDVYNTLGSDIQVTEHSGFEAETLTDEQVIEYAARAANGDKFRRLWSGDWQTDYGDKSQSEGDFALTDIIAFYSRNLTQTMRVFRSSQLGARPKARRGDYVSRMAKRAFDRMQPTVTIAPNPDGIWFDAGSVDPWSPKLRMASLGTFNGSEWHPDMRPVTMECAAPAPVVAVTAAHDDPGRALDFPAPLPPVAIPGLVGALVAHTWHSSVHQIAEASIASALSTMSVLCGRSYRHGTLGLNLYLMLLAQTSTGKSFAFSANDARFNAMLQRYRAMVPPKAAQGKMRADVLERMVIGEMGSAQGLAQHMPTAPSTLAQLDEYVDHIRLMAQPHPPPHLSQIRAELLKLMEMSGPGRVYRGRKYSKRGASSEESEDVISASLSILATGTPEQFYDELSNTLLTTGFLPRFTILDYTGGLTRKNENVDHTIAPELLHNLCYLFDKAVNLSSVLVGTPNEFVDVQPATKEAADALEWFDNFCYRAVASANEGKTNMAGMWARAKEHVRQIACLIAIGCNPDVPRIEVEHVNIAVQLVKPTLDKINRMVTGGEIGVSDDRLETEIKKLVYKMIDGGWYKYKNYPGIKRELFDNGFFQVAVIRNTAIKMAVFKQNKSGASAAFEKALNDLVRYGVLKRSDVNGQPCVTPLQALV